MASYDVVVIGGGPAGSTAAALLAQSGHQVALLEKSHFPRYHIGESLIPYCYFPLKAIGMIDKMKASEFQKKYSVQFASPSGKVSQPFYFFDHMDHEAANTWQVKRSEFDQMMLANAREKGADVFSGMQAKSMLKNEDAVTGVTAQDQSGEMYEFTAPVTIDATGRNGFSMTRNSWRVKDTNLQKVAIWTYYKGAKRDEGYDEGATTVAYIPEKGWFWYIPLADDTVSVGVVADKEYLYRDTRDAKSIFEQEVKKNQWIKDHLSTGESLGDYHVTGDFSYRSRYCAADGLVLTGDAFAFLDPVFSSGMYFALLGGQLAAEAVDGALKTKDYSAGQFVDYSRKFRNAIESMRKLVYAFYDDTFNFGVLLKKYPDLASDVTDCLIGNSEKDYTRLFEAIGEFADVPADLDYGMPYQHQSSPVA